LDEVVAAEDLLVAGSVDEGAAVEVDDDGEGAVIVRADNVEVEAVFAAADAVAGGEGGLGGDGTVFGADRLARFNIQIGQEVMVSFDIDAREYNGRWFNSIRAFDVRMVDPASIGMQVPPQAPMDSAQSAAPQSDAQAPFPPQMPENSADDLPF